MNFDHQTIAILSLLAVIILVLIFIVYRLRKIENSRQIVIQKSSDIESKPPDYEESVDEENNELGSKETDAVQALMSMHNGNTSFHPDEESITEIEESE